MTLLAALVFLLQDKVAEETFRQLEESIDKAKSLSVKAQGDVAWKAKPQLDRSVESTLLAADGNRFSEYSKMFQQGVFFDSDLRSDGSKVWSALLGTLARKPGVARADFSVKLLRMGVVLKSLYVVKDQQRVEEIKGSLKVSNLKTGPVDGASKSLTYTLDIALREGISADVTLWYDPATKKLLKRSAVVKEDGVERGTVTEKYSEYATNKDIPAESFKVPDEKK